MIRRFHKQYLTIVIGKNWFKIKIIGKYYRTGIPVFAPNWPHQKTTSQRSNIQEDRSPVNIRCGLSGGLPLSAYEKGHEPLLQGQTTPGITQLNNWLPIIYLSMRPVLPRLSHAVLYLASVDYGHPGAIPQRQTF
jgi:hypothetical protein